jgi:peroxiredoxin
MFVEGGAPASVWREFDDERSCPSRLRFTLPDDLKAVYLGFGIDLPVRNGEPSWTLPMPARFVVDRGGIVQAVDADPDYEHRPEPQKTVDDVKALA